MRAPARIIFAVTTCSPRRGSSCGHWRLSKPARSTHSGTLLFARAAAVAPVWPARFSSVLRLAAPLPPVDALYCASSPGQVTGNAEAPSARRSSPKRCPGHLMGASETGSARLTRARRFASHHARDPLAPGDRLRLQCRLPTAGTRAIHSAPLPGHPRDHRTCSRGWPSTSRGAYWLGLPLENNASISRRGAIEGPLLVGPRHRSTYESPPRRCLRRRSHMALLAPPLPWLDSRHSKKGDPRAMTSLSFDF